MRVIHSIMNCETHQILAYCKFYGLYSLEKAPIHFNYYNHIFPRTFIIQTGLDRYFVIIVINLKQVILFNPARHFWRIPKEILNRYSDFEVTLLDCNLIQFSRHSFGVCIFFIYHCFRLTPINFSCYHTAFPKHATYKELYFNFHDFLKVQNPVHFNKW